MRRTAVFALAAVIGAMSWSSVIAAESTAVSALGKPVFVQDIAPEAAEAVKVVDAFGAAIKAARLADAGALLDEHVLILESGGSERSRDEYLGHHAIEDAAFMQTAKQTLRYRQARVVGDVAWVGTESLIEATQDGKPLLLRSTETIVLRREAEAWKIVHIHWSSRRVKSDASATR